MAHLKKELLQDDGGQLVLVIPFVVLIGLIVITPGEGPDIACGKE